MLGCWSRHPTAGAARRHMQVPLLGNEIFLRLHDRHAEAPGKIEVLGPDQVIPFGLAELYPGEQTRTLVPLTRLVLELVAWAMEAPQTRPGPIRSPARPMSRSWSMPISTL